MIRLTISRARAACCTFLCALAADGLVGPSVAGAQPDPATPQPSPSATSSPPPQSRSIRGQITNTQQYHGAFPGAYSGPQSLYAGADTAKTVDATLFLGTRLWKGGEFYINPEVDQGFGL